jgi:hypothetical protein
MDEDAVGGLPLSARFFCRMISSSRAVWIEPLCHFRLPLRFARVDPGDGCPGRLPSGPPEFRHRPKTWHVHPPHNGRGGSSGAAGRFGVRLKDITRSITGKGSLDSANGGTVPSAPAEDFDTSPLEGCCAVTFGYASGTSWFDEV